MEKFLSAEVYAYAPRRSLSAANWQLRKAVIFIKSSFFQQAKQTEFAAMMETVCEFDVANISYMHNIDPISTFYALFDSDCTGSP